MTEEQLIIKKEIEKAKMEIDQNMKKVTERRKK
jgi:hypothetical protein